MYFAVFKSGFAITARSPSVDSYKFASLRSYSAGSGGAHSFLEVKGLSTVHIDWPTKTCSLVQSVTPFYSEFS